MGLIGMASTLFCGKASTIIILARVVPSSLCVLLLVLLYVCPVIFPFAIHLPWIELIVVD